MIFTDREFDIVRLAVIGLEPAADAPQEYKDDLEVLRKRLNHSLKIRNTKAAKKGTN